MQDNEKTYMIQYDTGKEYKEIKKILEKIGATIKYDWPIIKAMSASINPDKIHRLAEFRTREAREIKPPDMYL